MGNIQSNRGVEAWVKSNQGKLPGGAAVEERHIMKWTLTDPADLVVKLWNPTTGTSNSYDVDWGDSSSDTGVTTADKTHTYAGVGTYEVKITGQFRGLQMARGSAADKLKLVEFSNWGTTVISGIYQMFYNCTNMVYTATDAPDLTNLNAANGTQLRQAFYANATVTMDLSNWTNTGNLTTSMYVAFSFMPNLETLNLTGWDVSNITSMQNAFSTTGNPTTGCTFTLPSLTFTNCTVFSDAFTNARINTIDVSNWTLKTSGINCSNMFYSLDAKTGGTFTLDLSTWTNTSGITNMYQFFRSSPGLTHIDVTGWDTSNVTTMGLMCYSCSKLTHITGLSGFSAASLTGSTSIYLSFTNCFVLDFNAGATTNFGANWGPNLGNVTSFQQLFTAAGLTTPSTGPPDVSNWDMSGATSIYQIFQQLKTSGEVDVSNWDVSAVTGANCNYVFYLYSGTGVDVSSWELSGGITSMSAFARNANNLTTLDFSHANNDFSAVTSWGEFGYNSGLTSLKFNANVSFAATTNMGNLLTGCTIATSEYDALLTRLDATWVAPAGPFSGTLTGGNSKYTGGGAVATARAALVTAGWTITDGGIA